MRELPVLMDPLSNKGTAFSDTERAVLGLHGLLPASVETIDQQVARVYQTFLDQPTPLAQHVTLRGLQDTNEVLFHRLLVGHVEEMLPIVYTPTVADACRYFSHLYRRPRGLFLSYPDRDRLQEALRNRPRADVDVIVVTDGQRILGIGDQGIGGMGIPIGKLSLYTALGGIHPARTLPIMLDVGTDDEERLANPEYLGWRHRRITGEEYDEFIEQFVQAVRAELPDVLLQWEDFALPHARPILDRYRGDLCTFNDDIQGTAAVALATLLAAVRASGGEVLGQRIVMLGAGSAGVGVADYLTAALEKAGLAQAEARARIVLVDAVGVVHAGRQDLNPDQLRYAHAAEEVGAWGTGSHIGLAEVVAATRPTILIGLSTAAGAFTEPIVRMMAAFNERPIIFPLSNPTACCEADPADVLRWTDGRALVATGSPFDPVPTATGTVQVSQCNNAYVFPAVGLAVVASNANRITDAMLVAAAHALSLMSPEITVPGAGLLPGRGQLREVAATLALEVAVQAVADSVAPASSSDELAERIAAAQWFPDYDQLNTV